MNRFQFSGMNIYIVHSSYDSWCMCVDTICDRDRIKNWTNENKLISIFSYDC